MHGGQVEGAALRADGKTWVCWNSHKHQKEKRSMKHYAGLDLAVKEKQGHCRNGCPAAWPKPAYR